MAYFSAPRTLASSLIRALSSSSPSAPSAMASRSRFAFGILTKQNPLVPESVKFPIRFQTSGSENESLGEPSTNTKSSTSPPEPSANTKSSTSPPPKDAVILEGCDLEHWLIIMGFPEDPKPSEGEMVNTYVKTLAEVVGSEEEAKEKIYSVSTTTYTGFGALISEELSTKVKGLPGVLWVLPDSYLDVPNKDYGGDLFVDGKVIPRPKFRYTEKEQQQTNNRSRPRNEKRRQIKDRSEQR